MNYAKLATTYKTLARISGQIAKIEARATMPQSETMQRYDRARIANLTRQFNALRKETEHL